MRLKRVTVPKKLILHILVGEGKSKIGIIVSALPGFQAIGFSVQTQNNPSRMPGNKMRKIRTMLYDSPVKIVGIQRIVLFYLNLGMSKSTGKQKEAEGNFFHTGQIYYN